MQLLKLVFGSSPDQIAQQINDTIRPHIERGDEWYKIEPLVVSELDRQFSTNPQAQLETLTKLRKLQTDEHYSGCIYDLARLRNDKFRRSIVTPADKQLKEELHNIFVDPRLLGGYTNILKKMLTAEELTDAALIFQKLLACWPADAYKDALAKYRSDAQSSLPLFPMMHSKKLYERLAQLETDPSKQDTLAQFIEDRNKSGW